LILLLLRLHKPSSNTLVASARLINYVRIIDHTLLPILLPEFLSLIGTQHCLTLAYSKQENSIVERRNKEINRHIRALTYDNKSLTDYRFSLAFVQRILNSNYSDRLKISAADMLFGKIVKLDRGIFDPILHDVPLSTHMSKLLSVQDNLIKASVKELLREVVSRDLHSYLRCFSVTVTTC
jgi:hypothetical protein